jgi:hypothetical protein
LAVAVRDEDQAVLAVLLEKARGHAAKAVEVTVAQCVRECQHLQPSGHASDLGIERETNAAHSFQHALVRLLAGLGIVMEDDAAREEDHRQRGPSDQKGKTHGQ